MLSQMITDLLKTVLNWILSLVVMCLELITKGIMPYFGFQFSTFIAYIPFGLEVYNVCRVLSLVWLSFVGIIFVLKSLGYIVGMKLERVGIWKFVIRFIFFGSLSYFAMGLMFTLFKTLQPYYDNLLSGFTPIDSFALNGSESFFVDFINNLTSSITSIWGDIVTGNVAGMFYDILRVFINGDTILDVLSMVINVVIMCIILIDILKMIAKIAEMYVKLCFMILISPLGFVMGALDETSEIFSHYMRVFIADMFVYLLTCVLLRAVFVAYGQSNVTEVEAALGLSTPASSSGAQGTPGLIWAFMVVAVTKVALNLDKFIGELGVKLHYSPANHTSMGSVVRGVQSMVRTANHLGKMASQYGGTSTNGNSGQGAYSQGNSNSNGQNAKDRSGQGQSTGNNQSVGQNQTGDQNQATGSKLNPSQSQDSSQANSANQSQSVDRNQANEHNQENKTPDGQDIANKQANGEQETATVQSQGEKQGTAAAHDQNKSHQEQSGNDDKTPVSIDTSQTNSNGVQVQSTPNGNQTMQVNNNALQAQSAIDARNNANSAEAAQLASLSPANTTQDPSVAGQTAAGSYNAASGASVAGQGSAGQMQAGPYNAASGASGAGQGAAGQTLAGPYNAALGASVAGQGAAGQTPAGPYNAASGTPVAGQGAAGQTLAGFYSTASGTPVASQSATGQTPAGSYSAASGSSVVGQGAAGRASEGSYSASVAGQGTAGQPADTTGAAQSTQDAGYLSPIIGNVTGGSMLFDKSGSVYSTGSASYESNQTGYSVSETDKSGYGVVTTLGGSVIITSSVTDSTKIDYSSNTLSTGYSNVNFGGNGSSTVQRGNAEFNTGRLTFWGTDGARSVLSQATYNGDPGYRYQAAGGDTVDFKYGSAPIVTKPTGERIRVGSSSYKLSDSSIINSHGEISQSPGSATSAMSYIETSRSGHSSSSSLITKIGQGANAETVNLTQNSYTHSNKSITYLGGPGRTEVKADGHNIGVYTGGDRTFARYDPSYKGGGEPVSIATKGQAYNYRDDVYVTLESDGKGQIIPNARTQSVKHPKPQPAKKNDKFKTTNSWQH